MEGADDDVSYTNVFGYATDSERYRRDLVEDGKAATVLDVRGKGHSKLRELEMDSPIKQVLNCYSKHKQTRKVGWDEYAFKEEDYE